MGSEQTPRRASRVRSVHLVAYTDKTRERETASISLGKTLDLSPFGIRIEVNERLEKGDLIELEIGVGDKLIQAEARVVHVPPLFTDEGLRFEVAEGGCFKVGAEFTSIADEDRAVLISLPD